MPQIKVERALNNKEWIAKHENILVIATNKYDAMQRMLQILTH